MTMKIGAAEQTSRSFAATDIVDYVALGGQMPADGEVPEPLIGAMFSYLLGVKLPGMGTMYLKQESEFVAAVRVDETLVARVEITRIRSEKHLVDLRTTCHNDKGDLICDGRALVCVKDVQQ